MRSFVTTLLFAHLLFGVHSRPVLPRAETFELPKPVEGPGPTFDATATRAVTAVQIRSLASPDICFDISDFRAGDFRFNLVPLALKPCDPSLAGQKFDLITRGEHNDNQDGRKTLIVSSQQLTCVDRRSNKNDRSRPGLFACGGRAAGDGETSADQLFFFGLNGTTTTGFTLVRDSVNDGRGPGNSCMTLDKDGFVTNTPCSPPNFTPEQSWVIGDAPRSDASSPPAQSTKASGEQTQVSSTITSVSTKSTIATSTTSDASAIPPSSTEGLPEKIQLPKPAEGPGPTFDASAARAATGAHIRNAGSPNLCFDVSNFRAGDFRFNLVPIALKPCNVAIEGQKFDLITQGAHNNVQDGSRTLIVSSQQFTCVDRRGNINDRARPGLFACGGRAAGDGETTADQQYFFNRNASLAGGIGFPLARDAISNGNGPGNQCLTLNPDGFLSNTPCSPPNFTPEQTWFVGPLDGPAVPLPSTTSPLAVPQSTTTEAPVSSATSSSDCGSQTVTSRATVTVTVQSSQTTDTSVLASPSATLPFSSAVPPASTPQITTSPPAPTSKPEVFILPKPAEGPGPTFDKTAIRAATSAQIRSAADPELCFDVSDFRAGDFRFNLVPLALKRCDSTVEGQKFDLITKGEHNDVQDGSRTIIVSSQQLTCIDRRGNKNDRTRPGLFACGGRAVGDGGTSFDQQFFFTTGSDLSKGIGFPTVRDAVVGGVGPGNQCLTLNKDGFVSNSPCSPPNLLPEQTWIVG